MSLASVAGAERLRFVVTPERGEVSAELLNPSAPKAFLVLGHGAGSTLGHPSMVQLASALHAEGVATLRYNYPYSERGRGMDPEPVRLATVGRAVELARSLAQGLPMFAGGHSMSGRMTSLAHVKAPLPGVAGVIFLAFPLHQGAPNRERARHLAELGLPALFLSGTRDALARRDLLEQVVSELPSATLEWIEGADHSFKLPKRLTSPEPIWARLAARMTRWMLELAPPR